ncbi:MAG: hypothetical protein AAGF30_09440 [Pseudomonadota bacterium]
MSEEDKSRIATAERGRRIRLFGATMVGTAIGGYAFMPSFLWGVVLVAGLAMVFYGGALKQPGDDALIRQTCEKRTTGEVVLFGIGVFVLSGAIIGSVLLPSLLWIPVGLGGIAVTIRYQVRRTQSFG